MIVNTLKFSESGFPECLKNIPSPPKQIYWLGSKPDSWLQKPRVTIVGSRKITPYGKFVTDKLATELSRYGVVIISGLAYGVDVAAHRAALAAGGTTVAVLASGLDRVYPASHSYAASQIMEKGTLISEYAPGSVAYKANFIARNRIVSGLADVLLITEAAVNSGSLHTARFAMEQGRTVMAVPGNINSPISEGCNNLIKSGALPITDVSDILFALKISPLMKPSLKSFSGTEDEKLVYELIGQGIAAQEQIAAAAKIEAAKVSSLITMLEISGYIRPAGNGNWVLS